MRRACVCLHSGIIAGSIRCESLTLRVFNDQRPEPLLYTRRSFFGVGLGRQGADRCICRDIQRKRCRNIEQLLAGKPPTTTAWALFGLGVPRRSVHDGCSVEQSVVPMGRGFDSRRCNIQLSTFIRVSIKRMGSNNGAPKSTLKTIGQVSTSYG